MVPYPQRQEMAEGQSSYLIKEEIDKDNAMKLNAELLRRFLPGWKSDGSNAVVVLAC